MHSASSLLGLGGACAYPENRALEKNWCELILSLLRAPRVSDETLLKLPASLQIKQVDADINITKVRTWSVVALTILLAFPYFLKSIRQDVPNQREPSLVATEKGR